MNVLRDDQRFLETTSFEEGRSGARLKFIFNVVYAYCAYNMRPAVDLWLALISGPGDNDGDIWLWRDGDEDALGALDPTEDAVVDFLEEDWRRAQAALRMRVDRMNDARVSGTFTMDPQSRRIHGAGSRPFRLAAIAWRIATSKAMQEVDAQRGLRLREKYNLGSLVYIWRQSLPTAVLNVLRSNSGRTRNVCLRFMKVMSDSGHTCHLERQHGEGFTGLEEWIKFLSWMDDNRAHFEPLFFNRNDCDLCDLRFSEPKAEIDPLCHVDKLLPMQQWQVWGALMMSELSMEDYLPEDFEATLRPMYEFVDRKLQNHPSASVEHQLWQYIDRDPPDSRYAWWINAYPVEWREALARLLPEDWQCMHNAYAVLSRSNSPQPVQEAKVEVEGGDRVDLRTLLGAVLWLLHTARNASHLDCWDRWTRSCYRLQRIWTKLPPHSCGWVVEDFFDDLRQSKHTCYGMYGDGITALHAAAYSFLYGASALTVRPLLARTKSDPVLIKCPACLLCLFTSDSTGSVGIGSANSAYNTLRQEKLQWYSSVIAVEKPSPEDRDYEQWRRDWRPFFKCLLRCPPKFYKNALLTVVRMLPIVWISSLSWADHSRIKDSLNDLQRELESVQRVSHITALACSEQFWTKIMRCWERIAIPSMHSTDNLLAVKERDQPEIIKQLEAILNADTKPFQEIPSALAPGMIDLLYRYVTRTPAADRRSAFDAWLAGSKPWPSYPHLHARAHRLLVKTSSNIGYVPEICYVHPTEEWNDGLPVAIGGFADVYRAELNGHTVALKKLRVFSSDMTDQGRAKMKMLCREAMIWQHLEHPNILQFLGIDCDLYAGQWCLVSLWMENGTIMRYLKKRQPPADVNVINYMLYEIAQGLAYLRWENIVHGDLRGANIMIDEYHHVRLTDFGLASFAETTRGPSAQTGKGGSIQFMAPELHDPMRFGFPRYETTPSTDMYAFACVCYEMYTGHAPWHKEEKHDAAVILRVCKGDRPVRPTPEECSGKVLTEEVWRLIDACWTQAANKRPDVREIARFLASILQPMLGAVNKNMVRMLGDIGADKYLAMAPSATLRSLLDSVGHEVLGWPDDPILPTPDAFIVTTEGCRMWRKQAYSLYHAMKRDDDRRLQFARKRTLQE